MNTQNIQKQFGQLLKENNAVLIEKISRLLEGERPATPQFGSIYILGRSHKTVVMDTQEWMAENLLCPELGWHYDNDPRDSEDGFGTLHSHFAIPAIQGILPDGWRVPTNEDWGKLKRYVGEDAGKKLKSKDGWKEDGGGTDEFGFRVLPAGFRGSNGLQFYYRGTYVFYWSSSVESSSRAWYRQFGSGYAQVDRNLNSRSNGFAVRCVRDLNN